jgi:hypothetical protein
VPRRDLFSRNLKAGPRRIWVGRGAWRSGMAIRPAAIPCGRIFLLNGYHDFAIPRVERKLSKLQLHRRPSRPTARRRTRRCGCFANELSRDLDQRPHRGDGTSDRQLSAISRPARCSASCWRGRFRVSYVDRFGLPSFGSTMLMTRVRWRTVADAAKAHAGGAAALSRVAEF